MTVRQKPLLTIFFTACLIFTIIPLPSFAAATYYIADHGDDDASGTASSAPWKSIGKINGLSSSVTSGSTFLFNRGDVFRGGIKLSGYPTNVTFGTYGTGDNPVISGSIAITGWTNYSGSIYVADVSGLLETGQSVHHLFVNNQRMLIARYPNADAADSGWLQVDSSTNKKTFTDAALGNYNKPSGYWNGANVRIRTFSWLFETRTVSSSTAGGTIVMNEDLTQTLAGNIQPGWGYYLDNVLGELDCAGEWYFDETSKKVYLWSPGNVNPESLLVEGAVYDTGLVLFWHNHDASVEDLTFQHQVVDGININQCDRAVIRNCEFQNIGHVGINMAWNSVDMVFENNTFDDILEFAVKFIANIPAGNTYIQNNTIRNTAMIPGYGGDGVARGIAVRTYGATGLTIRNNFIENTGYNGIHLEGGSHIVENNVIRKSLMTLDDGGGIFVNCNNNQIRGNIVTETWGNRGPSSGTHNGNEFYQMGMGIFFQPKMSGNVVEDNTFADNTGNGIYPDRADNTTISGNVSYNNKTQLYLKGSSGDMSGNDYNNTISGNILFSTTAGQYCMRTDPAYQFGDYSNSVYCNPENDSVINDGNTLYSLAQWKAAYPGRDAGASGCPAGVSGTPELFINTETTAKTFDLGISTYTDLDGNTVTGSLILQPFKSAILILDDSQPGNLAGAISVLKIMSGYSNVAADDLDVTQNGSVGIEDAVRLLQVVAEE